MGTKALRGCGWLVVIGGAMAIPARASDGVGRISDPHSIRVAGTLDEESNVAGEAPLPASVSQVVIEPSRIRRLNQTAGTPPGVAVYQNENVTAYYNPGSNQRTADDLTLANGVCNAVYYSLIVGGFGTTGTFDVHTELWTGNPCLTSAVAIAGTARDFTVPNDQFEYLLPVTMDPSIVIPATVWMAVTFSGPAALDAAWAVAGQAEIGSTQNIFSENDSVGGCLLRSFTGGIHYAGFWATIHCDLPSGACCNGVTCTQTRETDCVSPNVWQGPLTTCQPNACQPGACCKGLDFETCADTSEAGCRDGVFHPNQTCAAFVCTPNFEVYENDFVTRRLVVIGANEKFADDLLLGAGAPCPLAAYELYMGGEYEFVPGTFNAHVELWTNDDRGTPGILEGDIPLALIPGTTRDILGIPANRLRQRVVAGPFDGVQLPDKVWMVVTTNVPTAGVVFAGNADVGFSLDKFAIFGDNDDNPGTPPNWDSSYYFLPNGFDPTNCPDDPCTPAASFRAAVWCAGEPPTGACCNDVTGTCTDGVLPPPVCEGRWREGETCDLASFEPPCGFHACCFPNPFNPNSILCQDVPHADCDLLRGASAPGRFCVDVPACPGAACIHKVGDCLSPHGTGGCENAFCCQRVCAADPFCCSTDWDSTCVTRARTLCSSDNCADALSIAGVGNFPFNNTAATTDGPPHVACRQSSDQDQITKDVWYCWTAPCTDNVYVGTCGQTTIDSRIAVYEGCECPVGDVDLLDCNDAACGQGNPPPQSVALFRAAANRQYLIRVGNYPLTTSGGGNVTISCGAPALSSCPAVGDCCVDHGGTAGCSDDGCCERVCACDPYCCTTEWDSSCATTGLPGSGCGASILCPATCNACASGPFSFDDPPSLVVDARRPSTAQSATPIVGIDALHVTAAGNADNLNCWSFCETNPGGSPNGVVGFTDNVGGSSLTVNLARPIAPDTLSKVTYLGTNATATLIGHPGNVSGDGFANDLDVRFLADALNELATLPSGIYSGDIDRSGVISGADLLELVGLLNGEGVHRVWNNTARPAPNASCP